MSRRHLPLALLLALALAVTAPAHSERKQSLGAYEGHYSLVPTLMLNPTVAAGYGISRGRDRALLSLSVLDADGSPVEARVTGSVTNLLGQVQPLDLREVAEGGAIYYLAEVRHDDREVLRVALAIVTPDGASHTLAFQQQMFWEGR